MISHESDKVYWKSLRRLEKEMGLYVDVTVPRLMQFKVNNKLGLKRLRSLYLLLYSL